MTFSNGIYDPLLVTASLVIAICASYTVLELVKRCSSSEGRAAIAWLLVGSLSMGSGIWSMHFVGMLAFSMSMPYEYDIGITVLSLVVGVLASLFALYIASRKSLGSGQLVTSGVLLGLGIAGMHYTGMAAMRMEAVIRYDPVIFGISVVIAIAACTTPAWPRPNMYRWMAPK
jgi:diguanylate cyclase